MFGRQHKFYLIELAKYGVCEQVQEYFIDDRACRVYCGHETLESPYHLGPPVSAREGSLCLCCGCYHRQNRVTLVE